MVKGESACEVAVFSAKRWDLGSKENLITSVTPCHDAQMVGYYQLANPDPLDCSGCKVRELAPQH